MNRSSMGEFSNNIFRIIAIVLACSMAIVVCRGQARFVYQLDSIVTHDRMGYSKDVIVYDQSGHINCIDEWYRSLVFADNKTWKNTGRDIYSYDSLQHAITKCEQVSDKNTAWKDLAYSVTSYDSGGRILSMQYSEPAGDDSLALCKQELYEYDEQKRLEQHICNLFSDTLETERQHFYYDSLGHMILRVDSMSGWEIGRMAWEYDNNNRCIRLIQTTRINGMTNKMKHFAYDHQGNIIQQTIYDIKAGIPTWQQTIVYTYRLDIESTDIKGYDARTDTTDIPVPGYKPNHPLICSIVYDKDGIIEETRYYYSKHRLNESK